MRLLEVLRFAYGVTELTAPHLVYTALLGSAPDKRASTVIRILGARHIVQSLVSVNDSERLHNSGGAVDLIHGITAVAFAGYDRQRRRPALINAVIAFVFAAGEIRFTKRE